MAGMAGLEPANTGVMVTGDGTDPSSINVPYL